MGNFDRFGFIERRYRNDATFFVQSSQGHAHVGLAISNVGSQREIVNVFAHSACCFSCTLGYSAAQSRGLPIGASDKGPMTLVTIAATHRPLKLPYDVGLADLEQG